MCQRRISYSYQISPGFSLVQNLTTHRKDYNNDFVPNGFRVVIWLIFMLRYAKVFLTTLVANFDFAWIVNMNIDYKIFQTFLKVCIYFVLKDWPTTASDCFVLFDSNVNLNSRMVQTCSKRFNLWLFTFFRMTLQLST